MAEENQKKHFLKNMKQELKRVIWPTKKQTAKNTVAVVIIVFLVSGIVLLFDYAFRKGNDLVIDTVTRGKVTEYKQEIIRKQEILDELAKYVDEETLNQYAQLSYYFDVATLESILESVKNPVNEENENSENQNSENENQQNDDSNKNVVEE